jgi:DNA-directed RNA polymerase subunit H (RpoH/RPB5)
MKLNHNLSTDHTVKILSWSLILLYPMDHELVPCHRKATDEERSRLAPVSQFPILRADDVITRYLGLDAGDVVHILRPDDTVYWRLIA